MVSFLRCIFRLLYLITDQKSACIFKDLIIVIIMNYSSEARRELPSVVSFRSSRLSSTDVVPMARKCRVQILVRVFIFIYLFKYIYIFEWVHRSRLGLFGYWVT